MKRKILWWSSAAFVAFGLVAAGLWSVSQRPEPDTSLDSKKGKTWQLDRVFAGVPLRQPVWMEQPPGDSSRWYVVEQAGRLVTFPNNPDHSGKSTALDITDRVKYGGEQGLLGLAFHPKFSENGYIYVNYTSTVGGDRHTRVSRFTSKNGGKSFDPGSEKILLKVSQPYANHNGGQVSFGPDGYLYIAYGDGGLAGDPGDHGQNAKTLLGTIARIDVDAKEPYGIPTDNPFANGEKGAPEVYAWGLRNPWRFSFDRKTRKLWTGDVGQNAWEEIDIIEKGKNYGWNVMEGTKCYDPPAHLAALGSGDCSELSQFAGPVLDYSHQNGDRSVTGGYVYRGTQQKGLAGTYVYGDFVSGRIWGYQISTKKNELLIDTGLAISSFVEAADGEIGVLDYSGGVYHLRRR